MILVLPLAFPEVDSGSFFSTSLIAPKKHVDFVDLYIPANPFKSLANNVVPAVVLFSIFVGVALMGAKEKQGILKPLSILSDALIKVANYIVFLTPIGVFAIVAKVVHEQVGSVWDPDALSRFGSLVSTMGLRRWRPASR